MTSAMGRYWWRITKAFVLFEVDEFGEYEVGRVTNATAVRYTDKGLTYLEIRFEPRLPVGEVRTITVPRTRVLDERP